MSACKERSNPLSAGVLRRPWRSNSYKGWQRFLRRSLRARQRSRRCHGPGLPTRECRSERHRVSLYGRGVGPGLQRAARALVAVVCLRRQLWLSPELAQRTLASGSIPPAAPLMVLGELMRAAARGESDLGVDEAALLFAQRFAELQGAPQPRAARVTAADRRRALMAAEWIEQHACELDGVWFGVPKAERPPTATLCCSWWRTARSRLCTGPVISCPTNRARDLRHARSGARRDEASFRKLTARHAASER
jgi:hypothetical protein